MYLTTDDHELIATATKEIAKYFAVGKHRVAASLRLKSGEIITAINTEGSFGCIDICAEQNVLGIALSQGKTEIESIVTVKHPKPADADQQIKVVSPCGKCRELLCDYAPNAMVIVRDGVQISKMRATELLPFRYSKV